MSDDDVGQPQGTDWALANHIHMVEACGVSPRITLFIGGLIVSGKLISARDYFREQANQMEAATASAAPVNIDAAGVLKALAAGQRRLADSFPDKIAPDAPLPPVPEYAYIHLAEARVSVPGSFSVPNGGQILWRGKLSSVDAFTLTTWDRT